MLNRIGGIIIEERDNEDRGRHGSFRKKILYIFRYSGGGVVRPKFVTLFWFFEGFLYKTKSFRHSLSSDMKRGEDV